MNELSEDLVLSARQLVKHYRQGPAVVEVLSGAELALQQGERLAIVGASGSGKSTLANHIEADLFNLGANRFLLFRRMHKALMKGDWERAACEMLDSKWARQVGYRSTRLALMMRRG